jgi:anaerobic selenocysteine-containing dehydrogenase
VLLPAALWTESDGEMVNSERTLTLFQRAVDPPTQALPDWQIIARIACPAVALVVGRRAGVRLRQRRPDG